ncbi:MAG TPA: hypothetical protein PLF22_09320 [Pseudomonadales bacterium]|nr:hypothetical protein [Pseudomonadales bacterium]
MKTNIEIYALAVCFVSVLCLVVLFGAAGYSTFQILTPEMTMSSYKYDKYQSNDTFWNGRSGVCSKDAKSAEKPADDVLTRQRLEAFDMELKSERRDGFQSLTRCFLFSLAAALSLFIHWKLLQKTKASSSHRSRSSRHS